VNWRYTEQVTIGYVQYVVKFVSEVRRRESVLTTVTGNEPHVLKHPANAGHAKVESRDNT